MLARVQVDAQREMAEPDERFDLGSEARTQAEDVAAAPEALAQPEAPLELGQILRPRLVQPVADLVELGRLMGHIFVVGAIAPLGLALAALPTLALEPGVAPPGFVRLLALAGARPDAVARDLGQAAPGPVQQLSHAVAVLLAAGSAPAGPASATGSSGTPARSCTAGSLV